MASGSDSAGVNLDSIFLAYPTTARKIIKNIPRHLRFNVAAVNWTFYEAVCDLDKKKHQIVIKGNRENGGKVKDDLIESILNSRREFDGLRVFCLKLEGQNLQGLIRIARKLGGKIRKLTMGLCTLNFRNARDCSLFAQFLEQLPNLEEWEFIQDMVPAEPHNLRPANIQPVLRNLRKFSANLLFHSSKAPLYAQFIASDTIQALSIKGWDNIDFSDFILRQSNVTSLEICNLQGISMHEARIYRHMKLEEVKFSSTQDGFVQDLTRDHPTILKLQMSGPDCNELTLQTIFHHADTLQVFDVTMKDRNCVHLLGIHQFKNLKELKIAFHDYSFSQHEVFMEFSRLKMPNITKLVLDLTWSNSVHFDVDQALENFAEHWENIQVLKYNVKATFSQRDQHCNRVDVERLLQNFQKLSSLGLRNANLAESDLQYGNVKKIKLLEVQGPQLANILQAFPNLTSLKILNRESNQMDDSMLTGFQFIAAHQHLKKLKMILVCTTLPSIDLLNTFKDLCRQVPKFTIVLKSIDGNLINRMAALMATDNDFCKIKVLQEITNESSLHLLNYNY